MNNMRHILILVYFGIASQNILASVVPHPDEEYEKPFFYLIDSEAAENNLILRLNSVDKQVEELSQKLAKLSSNYENLLERLSAIETETTKEENKIQDDFEVELEEVSQALPKWAADLDSDYLQGPEEFSSKFQRIGEKNYYIENKEKLNWFDARAECGIMNSHLVSLQNFDEWNAIRAHLDPFESYWVDIKESRSERNFFSETTPNKPPFLMWYTFISNEYCVELRSQYDHFMNDISCYNENYYVCEAW